MELKNLNSQRTLSGLPFFILHGNFNPRAHFEVNNAKKPTFFKVKKRKNSNICSSMRLIFVYVTQPLILYQAVQKQKISGIFDFQHPSPKFGHA